MKLSVEKIYKSYSSKIAVDDISFKMNSGDILGLLGPNGAGKTTLFYMIAGLLKKDSGSIILDSEDVSDKDISERSNLGLSYLPQEASIFRKLTVKENILTALEQRNDLNNESKFQELNNLLEEFNLNEFSETLGIRLSGGERRRCEVARALAVGSNGPRYFLLELVAALRNSLLLTPGISTGYWKPKNIPKLDLSSGSKSFILSPLKKISPLLIVYIGLPAIILDNVLFPLPFLPIIA